MCVLLLPALLALLAGCTSQTEKQPAADAPAAAPSALAAQPAPGAPIEVRVAGRTPLPTPDTLPQAGDLPEDETALPTVATVAVNGHGVKSGPPSLMPAAVPAMSAPEGDEPAAQPSAAAESPPSAEAEPRLLAANDPLPPAASEIGNPLRDGPPPAQPSLSSRPRPLLAPVAGPVGANQDPPTKPAPKPRKGKHSGEKFDAEKENGPIFVDWPKPTLALVLTGRVDGYLEPCGCAGLDRMKGGMARRHTLFRTLREQGWPVVGLDVGGLAKGFGKQAEMKFQIITEGMQKIGYDAIALGLSELKLPAGELVSVAAGADGKPGPFVSANVGLFGFAAGVTPKLKIIEAGGRKIGVTAVLGQTWRKTLHNDEVETADPEQALTAVLPELKKKDDYLVLLAHATVEESVALAKRFPEFHLVVTAGGAAEPPSQLSPIEGTKSLLVEVGEKGMNAVVLGFFDDPKRPVRYQRVPLDSRFASSEDMKLLMKAYQDQVKLLGLAGLNVRAVPHPQRELNGRFVGSQKCESCHEESYRIWKKSGHAKAFETLVKADPPRNFDPECISCHVIGWHPTKYFPYQGGYLSKEKTPDLLDVGCENCHGPGEAHCNAELSGTEELKKKLRKAVVVTKEESQQRQCFSCHDLDNSPDFDFEAYWPLIEHYEDTEN